MQVRRDIELSESLPWRAVRPMTVVTAVGGLLLVALIQSAAGLATLDGPSAAGQAAAYAGVAAEFFFAALVILVGSRMRTRYEGRTWVFIGIGLACAAIADLDWTFRQGAPLTFATPPETVFVQVALAIAYTCGAVAILAYAFHWRAQSDLGVAALKTFAVAVVGSGLVWFAVLRPGLELTRVGLSASIGYLVYSVADVLLVFLPGMFVLFTLLEVPNSKGHAPDWLLVQPWATLALGAAMIAGSGLGWFYYSAITPWAPGSLLDFFYLAGYVAAAVAVMLATDGEQARLALEDARRVADPFSRPAS